LDKIIERFDKIIIVFLLGLIMFLGSCKTLSPISDDAETLHEQIRTGQAVHEGERVRVLTQDGVLHRLIVASVEGDVLKGHLATKPTTPKRTGEPEAQALEQEKGALVEIPIADIVLVEREQVSVGKTAAAIGGGTLVLLSILLIVAVATF